MDADVLEVIDMMWGMMGFGALAGLIVLALLLVVVWWLVRDARPRPGDGALVILRERYARGEISREEYESRRKDLAH